MLTRGQSALVDRVYSVLHPLRQAGGGDGPLVETLAAYFDSGCVATTAAARLLLSVRSVTYRLAPVKTLTGFDPLDPGHRYTLQTAVLRAKLLDWPERHLPDPATSSWFPEASRARLPTVGRGHGPMFAGAGPVGSQRSGSGWNPLRACLQACER